MTNVPTEINGWELQSIFRDLNSAGNPGSDLNITFRKKFGGTYVELTFWGDAQEIKDLLTEWLT